MLFLKKGISIWAFPENMTLEEIFRLARKHGFEGVETELSEHGLINPETTPSELKAIRQKANENGIELYSVATGLFWKYSLTSDDESIRNKALYFAEKEITTAGYLGCDTVLIVPGAVSVDFAPDLGVVEYDAAYERALDAARKIAKFAENNGVSAGMENVWNKFLLSPSEMRNFIDEAGSEFIGSYFDVGNTLITGYPEQWIRMLGKRIKKVHFKDFKRSIGNYEGFVDLLAGDVDYENVMQALKDIGYDDWVTAEVFPYKKHNEMMLAHTSLAMDIILRRIRK